MYEMKNSHQHSITLENEKYPCSIGRSGVVVNKIEGDGGTPLGVFPIKQIYYRPDRINPSELRTDIPLIRLTRSSGWCDDRNSPKYNQFVRLPFEGSHEKLWREDNLYDIVGVLDFNMNPIREGDGSAIFLHIAREDYSPTEGCIALSKNDLLKFIAQFSSNDKIETDLSGNCKVIKGPSFQFKM